MANAGFSAPVEYFGQGSSKVIGLKSSTENRDYAVKQTATDERGDIVARDLAGERISPSAVYNVIAAGDLSLVLGSVNTVDTDVVVLLGCDISTSAASAPEVTLSGESIQSGGTASSTVTLPAIPLSPRHKAQILAGAFTLTGTGSNLTSCSLSVRANLTRATVSGDTVAHDVSGAEIVVSGTVQQTGATAPTIAAAEGWELTKPKSKENPDEGYIEWTFEVTKAAASTEPVSED
jgi:hypothetical protein